MALGHTQQEFAQVLKTAISTIARWETKDPPKGDALLQLADVAWRKDQTTLSMDFEILYLKHIMPRLKNKRMMISNPGLVICGFDFDNSKDEAGAADFLINRAFDIAPDHARELIIKLAKGMTR